MTEDEIMEGITNTMDMGLNTLWERVKDREAWSVAVHGVTKSRTHLSDSTTSTYTNKNLKNKLPKESLGHNFREPAGHRGTTGVSTL